MLDFRFININNQYQIIDRFKAALEVKDYLFQAKARSSKYMTKQRIFLKFIYDLLS